MSVLSTIARLFAEANAVPSIEATIARGGSFNEAVGNIRARVPSDTIISPQVLGTAVSRVRTALNIGADINAGRTVDPRLYAIDPTLPSGVQYRYRVAIEVTTPAQFPTDQPRTFRTVVPVDSDVPLTREEIRELAAPSVQLLSRETDSPSFRDVRLALDFPRQESVVTTIVSAYRQAIR